MDNQLSMHLIRVDPHQPRLALVAGRRHRSGRHLRSRGRGVPPPLNDDLSFPPDPEPSCSVSASSRTFDAAHSLTDGAQLGWALS